MPDWVGLAFLGAVGLLCVVMYILDIRNHND
ncbi:hypothetical protein [Enterobacter phage vB_ExiM_F5M1E]|nr:hypothetical protein [Enterobacter phage vB_ExiM_F1M1E]UNA02983.1 hypothetical protein [Enterobacter phage vB_ExiM_F2M1E]UNA03304.1 hypothetical protein [Enterobacter phage vB_ExiM_F4M1E]UNA03625.1 hypothetical protein [Enterobacter phage vB_ExiM_F5M1E]UNA03945.1 hypothetical protein [Pantoea phage vB_PdiM_F5M2A]